MLMIADVHRSSSHPHLTAAHNPSATYHNDIIPPNRIPDPDPDSCRCPAPPSAAPHDVQPLGLRLQALVRAHLPVAAAITKINQLNQIRYTLRWQMGDLVRDRVEELVSTYGGDQSWTMVYDNAEFLTVMPDCTLEEAEARAHQWQSAIANHPWEQIHPALQVTISVGIAAQNPLENYEALLADADIALRCTLS